MRGDMLNYGLSSSCGFKATSRTFFIARRPKISYVHISLGFDAAMTLCQVNVHNLQYHCYGELHDILET